MTDQEARDMLTNSAGKQLFEADGDGVLAGARQPPGSDRPAPPGSCLLPSTRVPGRAGLAGARGANRARAHMRKVVQHACD